MNSKSTDLSGYLRDCQKELGAIPEPLRRGSLIQPNYTNILVREIYKREEVLLKSAVSLEVHPRALLDQFYARMQAMAEEASTKVAPINALLGALRAKTENIKQIWVAIAYCISGTLVPFSEIGKIDQFLKFSKTRKCPSLQKEIIEGKTRTVLYAPEYFEGDELLWNLIYSFLDYDKIVRVQGKVLRLEFTQAWFTIANEFQKICNSNTVTYKEGGKVTVHNALVSLALSNDPMAKKPVFKAPVETLKHFLNTYTKDEVCVLECIAFQLKNSNFKAGEKSLIDSSYLIQRALPSIVYTKKDRKQNSETTVIRSYSPFGWHKMSSTFRKDSLTTVTLKDYGHVTVAARKCATAWTKAIPKLTKVQVTPGNMQTISQNLNDLISLSQSIKKSWILGRTENILALLARTEEMLEHLHEFIDSDTVIIPSLRQGEAEPLVRWLQSKNN